MLQNSPKRRQTCQFRCKLLEDKGVGNDDMESNMYKIFQVGATLDALSTCNMSSVISTSPIVCISHLDGRKQHVMMKHIETRLIGMLKSSQKKREKLLI